MNVGNKILKSWYDLLNGEISVPVYRVNAPPSAKWNHVIIRKESETETWIKSAFIKNPIVVVDIVTKFHTVINDSIVDEIDSEIDELYVTLPGRNNLPEQDGIQISLVKKEQTIYLDEDDGTNKIYRHITRYSHAITNT